MLRCIKEDSWLILIGTALHCLMSVEVQGLACPKVDIRLIRQISILIGLFNRNIV